LFHQIRELERIDLFFATRLTDLIVSGSEKVRVRDARNLHGVLKGEKDSLLRALFRLEVEEILAIVGRGSGRDFICRIASKNLSERALAGAVRAHHGMDLTGVHGEVDAFENLFTAYGGLEAFYVE